MVVIYDNVLRSKKMLIGYARVSTQDQSMDLQKDALLSAGCEKIFSDTGSGVKAERQGLAETLKQLRAKDTLVVWKLDRLGRSLQNLIQLMKQLQDRQVGFRSLQENIDTTTNGGKLFFHMFGALAEFERDIIRERTKAGLQAARARGRVGGRPCKLNTKDRIKLAEQYKANNLSITELCNMYKISSKTLYRNVAKNIK